MLLDAHPEVEDDALAGDLHQIGLRELERVGQHQHGEEDTGEHAEPLQLSGHDVLVDSQFGEVGRRKLQCRETDDRGECPSDGHPMRAHEANEPPHEPAVIGLAQDIVVRHGDPGAGHQDTSSSACSSSTTAAASFFRLMRSTSAASCSASAAAGLLATQPGAPY